MTARWPVVVSVWMALALPAHAQDDPVKAAITIQQHRAAISTDADLQHRLNGRLLDLAKQFWLTAKADGLKFEDVLRNIARHNAATEDFGLPLEVIVHDASDEFAVTARVGEAGRRAWVSLLGVSPNGIDLTSIGGNLVAGPTLAGDGGIDPACRFRVVFAANGELDENGHDDYAKSYPCVPFLSGALDHSVVADLLRWAADMIRTAAR